MDGVWLLLSFVQGLKTSLVRSRHRCDVVIEGLFQITLHPQPVGMLQIVRGPVFVERGNQCLFGAGHDVIMCVQNLLNEQEVV